jgi:amino acid adenylation domain-containing protein
MPSGVTSVPTAPLAERQTLIWLDEQLFPGAGQNELVLTARLTGPLDLSRFQSAWSRCLAAFDALRLTVHCVRPEQSWNGELLQPIPVEQLAGGAAAATAWIAAQSASSLWGQPRLWDAALLVIGADDHLLYLRLHHIIADRTSLIRLIERLAACYAGAEPVAPPRFREGLELLASYRGSGAHRKDQDYWGTKLSGPFPGLRLYGQQRVTISLALDRLPAPNPPATAARLRALAATPPFLSPDPSAPSLIVVATGLTAFLARVTESREITLGLSLANRPPAFSASFGLFMQQVYLRVEVDPNDTFVSLGARIADEARAVVTHGRACVSRRDIEHVSLDLLPALPTRFADLAVEVQVGPAAAFPGMTGEGGNERGTLGIQLHAPEPDGGSENGSTLIDFHAATFSGEQERRAVTHFSRVLERLASSPEVRLGSVDLLDGDQRREALRAARGPDPGDDAPDLVAKMSETAALHPEEPAVEAPDANLSFADLDRLTNQLAQRLRSLGVGPEARVGVSLPRGAGELCTMLATLKAGGAYVPLDPSYPLERLRAIVEDAAPGLMVVHAESPFATPTPGGPRVLVLGDIFRAGEGFAHTPLDGRVDPQQCAYILYTSGSTGRPKGVEIPRAAFSNFLSSMAHRPGLRAGERLLAITTTSFDISGLELLLPPWVGATVVIADRQTAIDPRRLRQKLEGSAIDVMQATPASWRLLLEAGWTGGANLRKLCGGEAMSPELAARLLATGGELWNMYGPTETTVWSSLERIVAGTDRVTIGCPIDRTQIYVLDPSFNPVPPGVVGELHIGGSGLARGYRGRADLTAERFVQNPHGPSGDRLYRTGDLGRQLDDGRFECLGRIDHQVKIRGFRIELGEIESVLRAVPLVEETLVVAHTDGAGDARLLAYWVGGASREALLEAARKKLPTYMIPSAFTHLDAFPLGPSGKIDRRNLPRPELVETGTSGRSPSTEKERRIAMIWQFILDLPKVGVDQDFFALGGTSVQAIEICVRIEQDLGVEAPLRIFFESPTVAGMAARIGESFSADDPIVVKLGPGSDDRPALFCLLGVSVYRDLALALAGHRTVIGMHVPLRFVPGREQPPKLPDIAAGYVRQIRRHQPRGPYLLAGLCFGGIVAYQAARQLEAAGEEVALVTVLDGVLPRGIRVDQRRRLRTYLRSAVREPRRVPAAVWQKASKLFARLPVLQKLPSRSTSVAATAEAVDVPIDGPEAAKLFAVSPDANSLTGRLLIVRATNEPTPEWVTLAKDHGWTGLTRRLFVRDVAATHLELLSQPNVEVVAAAIAQTLASHDGAATDDPMSQARGAPSHDLGADGE